MPLTHLQQATSLNYTDVPLFTSYGRRSLIEPVIKATKVLKRLPSPLSPPAYSPNDELPHYSCDLYREGYLYLKHEKLASSERSPDRSWHLCYFILQGTALNIYSINPHATSPGATPRRPIQTWNLAQLNAREATQYFKYPHTFRVHHDDGSCHLVRAKDGSKYRSWLKDLQASSLLAMDIDERPIDPY